MAIQKPSPYIPSFLRAAIQNTRPLQLTFSEISDSNIQSTSSFIYDPADAPLKSTQQLNVDWSQFENHTFFMSAEAKVNLAFEQIINGYPFDGTRAEVETFFEKLTGFDKWVFDQFPVFHGQLMFSGTQVGETSTSAGSYIIVTDAAGALYPELAKTKTGASVLNPRNGASLTIEMQLYVPTGSTAGTQCVCQKLSGSTHGFSLYLMPTASISTVEARFSVVSGAVSMTVPAQLSKGAFNHVCVTLNRDAGVHYLQFFTGSQSVAVSPTKANIGELDIDASNFLIGSGTAVTLPSVITPNQTLSGTIDEFRVFHSVRSIDQQQLYAPKSIFATPDLKLYYRFNEPRPLLASTLADPVNSIVIDSSGNALHSTISNFTGTLREDASTDPTSAIIFEKDETTPVLFPQFQDVIDLNAELLSSASTYDQENPNLITRLVPQHYLLEGAAFEGFVEPEGNGNSAYGGNGIPGQGQLGSVQLFLSMLYIWARFFDEMKLYIDAFSTLRTVDYDLNKSMPNNFLLNLVKQYGFNLPPLFNDSTLEQYVRAENIDPGISSSDFSIKSVQNELLRRVLINLPAVIRSKGTQHSIKAFLRSVGIDPENSVRLREYGGPTTKQLSFSREFKREVGTMVEMSSSTSLATSPYLSASRVEPGYPFPAGTFVTNTDGHYVRTTNTNDNLLTSGSWTVEMIVKYTPTQIINMVGGATQSLARLCVMTGSNSATTGVLANLMAISSSFDPKLMLYVRPGDEVDSPLLMMSMSLSNNALFDSDKWNISFGCTRNDQIGSFVSSSYFLRIANQNAGDLTSFASTSSFFYELHGVTGSNAFRKLVTSVSAAFLAVGNNQTIDVGTNSTYRYLNNVSYVPSEATVTAHGGMTSNLRFWSKALTETEWKEHVRNYRSVGVLDPLVNYNFTTMRSGSFEKLRLDTLAKQTTRRANATASLGTLGAVTFLDFSLNGFHMTGSGFAIDRDCVRGEIFDLSYLSPNFDEASTNEKIRIRSFQTQGLVDATPWAGVAPVYEIVKSEEPTDDTRFAAEFSLIDALNRDIVTLFATFDALDNALGAPELLYSPDYPDLARMRTVYFNRIQEKLNYKAFFEFFRWFDNSIGTFIEQLIPRKTRFKGTNFIIESHMLERHKLEYLSSDMYLNEDSRNRINDVLLLQQIEGSVSKY